MGSMPIWLCLLDLFVSYPSNVKFNIHKHTFNTFAGHTNHVHTEKKLGSIHGTIMMMMMYHRTQCPMLL